MTKKKISVVSSCFNEAENLDEWYSRLTAVFAQNDRYDWEIVIADNCSLDGSRDILRRIAAQDTRFKVIFNANNFGHIRSPMNAFFRATGDAVVPICSDLQDPPEKIIEFVRYWEEGYKVVCAVKSGSRESRLMYGVRVLFYKMMKLISETEQIHNFYGTGLYDRQVVEAIRKYDDPYPYFRGLIAEVGFRRKEVPFVQDRRRHGVTKNNFFTLYDMAMTGVVHYSKLPLRMAVFCGFLLALTSMLIAVGYFIYKILYWNTFQLGLAPLVIGLFFFSSIQLIFIGIIGEYLGAVWGQVKRRPLVIEEETLNFDK